MKKTLQCKAMLLLSHKTTANMEYEKKTKHNDLAIEQKCSCFLNIPLQYKRTNLDSRRESSLVVAF